MSAALEVQRQSSRAALSLMEDALAAQKQAEESEAALRKLSLAIEQSPESIVITNSMARSNMSMTPLCGIPAIPALS